MAEAGPVFVSAEATEAVFRWPDAIDKMQKVYSRSMDARALPPRTIAGEAGGWLRSLPAVPPGSRYFGAKLMGGDTSSPTSGAEYVVVLFDRETSRIAAFLDANLITGYRTAATSAAALDRLAQARQGRLGVLGSGLEAEMHIRAFASIRRFDEIVIFSPTPAKRTALAERLTSDLGVRVRSADSPDEALDGATIILAAARSRGELPIVFGDRLRAGTTVVSIGSTVPAQREVDVSVVERAELIVCDVVEEVLRESGDLIAARDAGIAFDAKSASLNALMAGELDARIAGAGVTMFKSVGSGVQDIAIAELMLEKATEAGLATPLPIAFKTKFRS